MNKVLVENSPLRKLSRVHRSKQISNFRGRERCRVGIIVQLASHLDQLLGWQVDKFYATLQHRIGALIS
jgi:hypothetical protein